MSDELHKHPVSQGHDEDERPMTTSSQETTDPDGAEIRDGQSERPPGVRRRSRRSFKAADTAAEPVTSAATTEAPVEVYDDEWAFPLSRPAPAPVLNEPPAEPEPEPTLAQDEALDGGDTNEPATTRQPSSSEPAANFAVDENAIAVIRPMQIIEIESDLPPVPPTIPPQPMEVAPNERSPSLIDVVEDVPEEDIAVTPDEFQVRQTLDEVEPIEEIEPESDRVTGDEELEEVVLERDSDIGEEIPIDMEEAPDSSPKKPPPPPRRPRAQADAQLDLAAYASPAPPAVQSASPPPVAAVIPVILESLPQSMPAPVTPPPPPAAPRHIESEPTETEIRRVKPWWEDLFGDDFLHTLDAVDHRVIHREVDFIEERLGMEKGAVILDLACGFGYHAVEIASRGYSVVGYDLSIPMLARAADEAQERGQKLNFLQGDMREMSFDGMFDGVYCWSTSFGYFDDETNADLLVRVHRALRSGGMLLLDVINRDYVSCRQPNLVWFEGDGCVCMDEMQVDFFSSRLKVKRTVMFEDGRSRELDYSIRLYGLHELGKLLHDANFKVVEVTGHPAHPGIFFGSESPRIIVLAERS